MNWNVFNLKYENREEWAFEQMSYLLFCAEFDNKIGLFRYKNQTGIETNPIEKNGLFIGFQSKYYSNNISQKKDDIIDSIKKAKVKNHQLNVIYLYLNKELSESSKKRGKHPKYQIDIENNAKAIGVVIEWRVPSHYELQLSLPENKYIFDIFFSFDPNAGDLLKDIYKHNENILRAIQTDISFNLGKIKIDRGIFIEQIASSLEKKQSLIIAGEGGCGKTSVFKEFYDNYSQKIPICIYKATELNVSNINILFHFSHQFSLEQFLETYKSEPDKVFVIDSAEKLSEFANNDTLNYLIQSLRDNEWTVVFTTRNSYINDLTFHIRENFQFSCEVINIPIISNAELNEIAEKYGFSLPDNLKFLERLRNLFYLKEYLQYYSNIDKQGDFRAFVDLLWKKRIQNTSIQKDNIHIERDRCLIFIAKKRCETGLFYINGREQSPTALFQLKQDEILGYDEIHDGYFITHDIYEEWALNRLISRDYFNCAETDQFFKEMGESLPIRRAFRLWLSEQLSDDSQAIKSFVESVFPSNLVSQFWKDELLVSVLLSNYSESFFMFFEKEIVADDFKILKRVLFLLRIACTEISTVEGFDALRPKGKGWEIVIAFIHKYKSPFFENNLKQVLPILTDWCWYNRNGETTKLSGLLALWIIQKTETEKNFFIHGEPEEVLFIIIFNSAIEIKDDLKEIFDKVIVNKWVEHKDPYEGLCSKILEKPYLAVELIKVLPIPIIHLCDLFWQKKVRENDRFAYYRNRMESRYGLVDQHQFHYSPASAFQTPIYWLLKYSFKETVDFIIAFINRSIEIYRHSDYGKEDIEEIILHIEDQEIKQYSCWAFWGMYRGVGSPVVPYLLQCIHMALEKFLLEFSGKLEHVVIEFILKKILVNSKSTSLTSVVSSVVLANPDKFYDIALDLFKTIELFHMDSARSTNEYQAKSIISIGYGFNDFKDKFYTDERLKTCEDKHRNLNLEALMLNYQFIGVKNLTSDENAELIKKIHIIIDKHKEAVLKNGENENSYGILLARMDRRNLTPKITHQDDNSFIVEFTPTNLSEEQMKQSTHAANLYENTFRYSSLRLWSDFITSNRGQTTNKKSEEYDRNPQLVLTEVSQLVEDLNTGKSVFGLLDCSIPVFACSKLLIYHRDMLSKEDKDYCKEIIVTSVSRLFSDDYDYQISDGIEASIHGIPLLLNEYPKDREPFIITLILSLFDKTPIGNYKRVCDYAIEAIQESQLWDSNFTDAQAILMGFIKLKPLYNQLRKDKRNELDYRARISKESIISDFKSKIKDFSFTDVPFDIKEVELFDIYDLEEIFLLMPSNTNNEVHLKIYENRIPFLASQLLKDRRRERERDNGFEADLYKVRRNIFKKYARFILERETNEIDIYLQPFIDSLDSNEETSSFLDEIISAEDHMRRNTQFWYIWNKLYPKIKDLCNTSAGFHLNDVISSYLLAWRWWRDGVEEWHSLKEENLPLYANISKELGHYPAVLYSITKVLNSIGSKYGIDGVDWMYNIISQNKFLKMGDLEDITQYYLENIMRKFIFTNKERIKHEIKLKIKVIPILDFMIEKGSIHGYLLRESIL